MQGELPQIFQYDERLTMLVLTVVGILSKFTPRLRYMQLCGFALTNFIFIVWVSCIFLPLFTELMPPPEQYKTRNDEYDTAYYRGKCDVSVTLMQSTSGLCAPLDFGSLLCFKSAASFFFFVTFLIILHNFHCCSRRVCL